VVLRRANDLLEDGEVKSFREAVREVLRRDPQLAEAYAASVNSIK